MVSNFIFSFIFQSINLQASLGYVGGKKVNEGLYHQFANAFATYLILEAWLCHNTATTR